MPRIRPLGEQQWVRINMLHFSRLDLEVDSELTRFLELHDSVLIEASDLATEPEDEEEEEAPGKIGTRTYLPYLPFVS